MPRLVIFFIGVIAIVIPTYVAGSISIQDIDVDKLIELVQQQRVQSDESESQVPGVTDDDEELSGNNLLEVITKIVNNKVIDEVANQRKERDEKPTFIINTKNTDSQQASNVAQILERLIHRDPKSVNYRLDTPKTPKKRLPPSRLIWDVNNKKDESGPEDYSKIFVLLNPQALQSGKSQQINKLVSKLLSLSGPPVNKDELKLPRYKGFAVKQRVRRRRNSRENSGEDGPKRGRGNGGGGGGGGGYNPGHTAIPYIRHRGDNIFEKEN